MNGCDASDWSGWSSAKWYLCYGHTNCSCPLHMLSARTHLTMFHACGLAAVSCRLTVPWVLRSSPTIQLHFPIFTCISPCTILCCPECAVSDWSGWSPCNVACGLGAQFRVRSVPQGQEAVCGDIDLVDEQICYRPDCGRGLDVVYFICLKDGTCSLLM